ncbi:MAG: T9SS type A sorting domain-containing protein [Desulfobulbaceae bacterium]|nr:T9SS type A sorting domain-containing protein [Candidatus Kapabacteria bacterium]MBS3999873.1 T9SS type A sorting domain-containing protein [Desulfobulbaceae bacterium]
MTKIKNILKLSLLLGFIISIPAIAHPWYHLVPKDSVDNFFAVQNAYNQYWSDKAQTKGSGWKQFKRWEHFWGERVYPSGIFPDAYDVMTSYSQFLQEQKDNNQLQKTYFWREEGPKVVPENLLSYQSSGIGRLNVIRMHPTNSDVIFAGSASGGIWKSTNKGGTWELLQFTDVLSLGISDIAISKNNPDLMYAATGDDNGHFQSRTYSIGVLKSTDGGKSWASIGLDYEVPQRVLASRILIHPEDDNIVIVGGSNGIFKTTDGGNEWVRVYSTRFVKRMEFKPDDPSIVYAVTSGFYSSFSEAEFYKSTDGGNTWQFVRRFNGAVRLEIGVTPHDANYIYLLGANSSSGSFHGIFRSTDAGSTFELIANSPNILSINVNGEGNTGQGFYDLAFAVSPVDKDQLYVGGIHIWKSMNGGKNWQLLNHWTGSNGLPFVHADQHNLVINPLNLDLYSANDGGLYISSNNGSSWKDISSGMGITQLWSIDISQTEPGYIALGTQDNGSHILKNGKWYHINGGDGMVPIIDSENPQYLYTSMQNGSIYRSVNGGNSFNRILHTGRFTNESSAWVAPFVMNPQNSRSLYVGYRNIYKTENRGSNWRKISSIDRFPLNVIAVAPSDTNVIYTATASDLYVTKDEGETWKVIFTGSSQIKGIAIDDKNPERLWVTLSGYSEGNKVFEINGDKVQNISYNLPNVPVSSIIYYKNSARTLYIGTDVGVMSFDPLLNEWQVLNVGLPPVVVNDMKISYNEGRIYVGTHGRGVWSSEVFDCNMEKPEFTYIGPLAFCQGQDSVKLTLQGEYYDFRWSNGETTKTIWAKESGSYYVNVRNAEGCSERSDFITVNVTPVSEFEIKHNGAGTGVICGQSEISLYANFGFKDYKWSTGATTAKIVVSEPGEYWVTAVTKDDCPVKAGPFIVAQAEFPEKPHIYFAQNYLKSTEAVSYKWYFNDKYIENSDTIAIELTLIGKYEVETFNEYGCSSKSEPLMIETSIYNDVYAQYIQIVPNPARDYVSIILSPELNAKELVVYDAIGRELLRFDVGNELNHSLNTSKYPNGVYKIVVSSTDKKIVQQLIITN